MKYDPNEECERLKIFKKDEVEEDFFLHLNNALVDVILPEPEYTIDINKIPIIYIVGVPRSGTSLLSQLVSRYLPLGYINNLISRFWSKPSVGIRLSMAVLGNDARKRIKFVSSYGTTKEPGGPHEFGYFWRHWLKLDESPTHHLSEKIISSLNGKGLKNVLENEIIGSFRSPVVFKNVICGFHAEYLTKIHQSSLFLHIIRNPFDTATSILHGRKARFGSYDSWWSLKPSTYPFNIEPKDAAAEVAMQVVECRNEIDEELAKPKVTSMYINYDELCKNSRGEIDKICLKLKDMGCNIKILDDDFPKLTASKVSPLPANLELGLRKHLQRMN